ncbi:hypothetical protein COW36_23420 [bacterium (Candidatus Blackallbacteria) CG17_big_fil_post_rev_8_21_14_2_50_48_46]|uniref:Uncharacterized protein n=1 Tax=bacterium (Candidatus Blackallbacteria) CG17_big_fil_post_rev_8_21_14_2_50_48_46 TaxID=2014261 RepID=A0A2M7FYW6_9BACT|nr:MAG: hypothetical protein COW64_17635 [bacterium (Candidatus Blackallbacteria) CG18_big_fil_WC_8_21_14_2_50_49_26]PIW13993.1 MAG: hypothetical protein COW36_23420 [bacterium (Candidatus Blackallbacteria) CG17_big_fil_post_rev_8_21_14_2_50_48_46]PIW46844.1 MAG: hypothetical protein COW20_14600 [bacterium (Candidatus Blackallbacteria) CG13_big_fil_rev_8_21_14_2_50_49_14]
MNKLWALVVCFFVLNSCEDVPESVILQNSARQSSQTWENQSLPPLQPLQNQAATESSGFNELAPLPFPALTPLPEPAPLTVPESPQASQEPSEPSSGSSSVTSSAAPTGA